MVNMENANLAVAAALGSAALYGISVPAIKLWGAGVSSALVSGLLYLGAGIAMVPVALARRTRPGARGDEERRLTRKQAPLCAAMVALNSTSAICLAAGIALSSASAASLLGNFEVVATAVFAWLIFRERMGGKMALACLLIAASGMLLSWDGSDAGALFKPGSLLILLACVLWGLENNCTRALSEFDVVSVTMVKGVFTGALGIGISAGFAAVTGTPMTVGASPSDLVLLLAVGAVSYGASIVLYIWAQRWIGAARTGNCYSVAPFVGVALSWACFGPDVSWAFVVALGLSVAGVALTVADTGEGELASLRSA